MIAGGSIERPAVSVRPWKVLSVLYVDRVKGLEQKV